MPMSIEIIRTGVVLVGSAPAFRFAHPLVAILVPAVPIIRSRSIRNPVFRVIKTADGHLVTFFEDGAALRRGDLSFTFAHDHIGFRI